MTYELYISNRMSVNPEKSLSYRFRSNTCPDPPEKSQSCLANIQFRWRADDGSHSVVIESSLPLSTKTVGLSEPL